MLATQTHRTTGVAERPRPARFLRFLAADHHGTSSIATYATTQAVTKRYSTPFGAPRGTKPTSWPDDKAFLGKPADSATGLTHIGAREYDPGIGQFISADPLLEIDKHQTLNGYSYAGQAPATNSDPTGTCLGPGNGRCQPGDNSGTPDPSFPINTSSPPGDGGPGWNGTAPTGGSGGTAGTGGTNGAGGGGSGPMIYPVSLGIQPAPYFNLQSPSTSTLGYNFPFDPNDAFGIIDEGDHNPWETSSALFVGWLLGKGFPLGPVQDFRGGAVFAAKLSRHWKVRELRSGLLLQAVNSGMAAPSAKEAVEFQYKDVGPEPGSAWYKFNSLRGAARDLSGVVTNGKVGMDEAGAFLGTYKGTGRIRSVDRRKGNVVLEFTAWNRSDWKSATHAVPSSLNPYLTGVHGAAVEQNFSWREKLPLSTCGCWMQ
ncbi:RHS repeat domain-containing protein [Streptomyces anulatus]